MRGRIIAIVVMAMIWACGTGPAPIPPPVPVPPAPTGDPRFAGFHDCSIIDIAPGVGIANTCAEVENPAVCFSGYADHGVDVDLILCAARDVQAAGFIEIARGTAGPELTARARRLREWLASTGATLRSVP